MIHPVVLYRYIIIQVRQKTQHLEIEILVNIYGYMFRLILSHLQANRSQNSNI
jgi:collagenase-like PrtC family protease